MKPWYTSRTILASIAALVASLLGVFGYSADAESLTEVLVSVAGAVAALVAIYGRVVASKRIRRKSDG